MFRTSCQYPLTFMKLIPGDSSQFTRIYLGMGQCLEVGVRKTGVPEKLATVSVCMHQNVT